MKQKRIEIQGKRVAVLGAGRSGRAAAELVLRFGGQPTVFDSGKKPVNFANWPQAVPVFFEATTSHASEFSPELTVISPGIETESVFVEAFKNAAGRLVGEVELAAWFFDGKIIGITGTNGKTTTTELVEQMLQFSGKTALACGNYGVPISEVVLQNPQPDVLALELSSFQLETIHDFRCDVAVWLNFAPDHMDRYKTVDEYFAAKFRIFENMDSSNVAIVRAGENLGKLSPKVVSFTTEESEISSADWSSINGTTLLFKGEKVGDLSKTKLRGLHNAENAMAALAACEALLGEDSRKSCLAALAEFCPPEHRCELVKMIDNVEFINDSKATNLHALEAALRSQTRRVVLIVGGKNKGLDYAPLCDLLRKKVSACLAFGEIREQLASTFAQTVPCELADSLENAVSRAKQLAENGDVVLFSPGTSSFDMFSGYEQRGEVFKKIVNNLK